ncbi:MAG: helix-turn-helix transcriptional regulator [Chloroflexi bacterium]|uniref:Helix-turn-helix domain-containing protein n=1 Tax=Candidatus Chlorohelix allophototropha TaxID=3003348 RepID=A0A8T7LZ63_9CHLR|nr:helix-turn-helix transcriptional regulator [Chloroflexota bacterium]WJW66559.1 helix-turn-helix domain-containing protein [Chloroflexota bacterium L227-S17]
MSLGSYIIYLRALKDGITPREVASEVGLPEHYIHAIELEKHAGDVHSRGSLAEYFGIPVDEFSDYARSTSSRLQETLKHERRPQMGFLLMNGETLLGTVDGADNSIIKIVELNSGIKTILQRHAIKKWWSLKPSAPRRPVGGGGGGRRPFNGGGGGGRPPRPGGGRPTGPNTGSGPRPGPRPGGGNEGGYRPRPPGGGSGGGGNEGGYRPRPPGGGSGSGGNEGGYRPRPPGGGNSDSGNEGNYRPRPPFRPRPENEE